VCCLSTPKSVLAGPNNVVSKPMTPIVVERFVTRARAAELRR
jgi:hypothetical protein